jgi:hypothetical protein
VVPARFKPPAACSVRTKLLAGCLCLIPVAAATPGAARAARGCAPHVTTTTKADGTTETETQTSEKGLTTEKPCWVEVEPYPFTEELKSPQGETVLHYDIVTSLAFRAWNRGLALAPANQDAVWSFNGTNWAPVPGFIGPKKCPGNTIVWAGKVDYWVIGGSPKLCRFDGDELIWDEFEASGGITSAACFAWNNCWFFGKGGLIVHWNGETLANASPNPLLGWLQGEYLAAVAREGPSGERFAVAAGVASQPGRNEPQLYGSSGGAFSPLAFRGPAQPADLVAADLDSAGQGWVAGNPPGKRATGARNPPNNTEKPMPSQLVPISTSGTAACVGPPEGRFTWTDTPAETEPAGAFLWASVGVIPSTDEVLAGGRLRAVGVTMYTPSPSSLQRRAPGPLR